MSLTLFSTLAVRAALEPVVLLKFTADTGIPVRTVFDPTQELSRRIKEGESFDVLVGVAVGLGAATPDISDSAQFIATLLSARSIAYSRTGASGIYFAQLIDNLGIAGDINAHATVLERGFTAEAVVDGRADLAIQQLSELAFVRDVQIVGPCHRASST